MSDDRHSVSGPDPLRASFSSTVLLVSGPSACEFIGLLHDTSDSQCMYADATLPRSSKVGASLFGQCCLPFELRLQMLSAPASSSTDAPLDASAPSAKKLLCEVSFEGRLFLDRVADDEWILTETATHFKRRLHGSVWILEVDGAHACLAEFDGEGEEPTNVFAVEEELPTLLCMEEDDPTKLFLVTRAAPERHRVQCFSEARSSYNEADVHVNLTGSRAELCLKAFAFRRARAGCLHVYFGALSLYKALGLTSNKGVPSKWAYSKKEHFRSFMNDYFEGDHVVSSKHMNHSLAFVVEQGQECMCLPEVSLSSCSLLRTLLLWSSAIPTLGGLRRHEDRENAAILYAALVRDAIASERTHEHKVYATREWRSRWPRTDAGVHRGVPKVTFTFPGTRPNTFTIDALPSDAGIAMGLEKVLEAIRSTSDVGEMRFDAFMKAASAEPSLSVIVAQLSLWLARRLEKTFARLDLARESRPSRLKTRFEVIGGRVVPGSYGMEESLLQYTRAAVEHSRHHNILCLSTDKATVATKAIQNTVFCWPDNVASIACPQARA